MLLAGCSRSGGSVPEPAPAVYYWRTSLTLDDTERAFLRDNHIGKVYLRLFDVVVRDGKPVPQATLTLEDTLPDTLTTIPVVFITPDVLQADTAGLAERLVARVIKMARVMRLPAASELQLDCDWTPATRDVYFALLTDVRTRLQAEGWRLSTTIRLHQLAQPAPPIDYGVLMVYNTGDFRQRTARNPIFSRADIEPFLPKLKDYPLPLCAAYPNFRWQRLFSGDTFKGLLYSENLRDSTVYEALVPDSLYRVVQGRTLHGALQGGYDIHLSPGDEVVVSRPAEAEVVGLARAMEKARPGLHEQAVVYHLDSTSIQNLSSQYYESLYRIR